MESNVRAKPQSSGEIHNLAGLPDYRTVQERLSSALEVWMTETNDQGRFREPPEIPAEWDRRMRETYESRPKKTLDVQEP